MARNVAVLEQESDGTWWASIRLGEHLITGYGESPERAEVKLLRSVQAIKASYVEKGESVPTVLSVEISDFEERSFEVPEGCCPSQG